MAVVLVGLLNILTSYGWVFLSAKEMRESVGSGIVALEPEVYDGDF